jgi:hypothetical protein
MSAMTTTEEGSSADSAEAEESSDRRRWLWIHLASLAVGFVFLLYADRNQWFWYDEWDFIARRGLHDPQLSIWQSHNGHWSTLPILAYRVLLYFFGVRTYWPYIGLLIVLHLALAHILWRVMLRVGVTPFVATGLAAVFIVLGSGYANIVWAFQIGFVGSMVLGWLCVLAACSARWNLWRLAGTWALGIAALLCSGAGTTMVALAAFAALVERGWRRAVVIASLPAVVFLVWYFPVGSKHTAKPSPSTTPKFVELGITHSFSTFVGSHRGAVGALILLAMVAAVIVCLRENPRRTALAALALASAFLFFVIAGVGRSSLGAITATSTRYVYEAIALGLPAFGLTLDMVPRLVRRIRPSSRGLAVAAVAALSVLIVWMGVTNIRQLRTGVHTQAGGSMHLRQQLDATVRLIQSGQAYFPAAQTAKVGSPYMTAEQMARMVRAGWFPTPGLVTDPELELRQRAALQVAVNPKVLPAVTFTPRTGQLANATSTTTGSCEYVTPVSGRPVILLREGPPTSFTVRPSAPGNLKITLAEPGKPGVQGSAASYQLVGGRTYHVVTLPTDLDVRVYLPATTSTTVCGVTLTVAAIATT